MNIQPILELSASHRSHLCPRQILSVRIGLTGPQALDFFEPPVKKNRSLAKVT